MAGRKDKNTVDYFPHYCDHGKTLFILEKKFGNDGYAGWFKTLEVLGKSEYHFIDCKNDEVWEFMQAKIGLMDTELTHFYHTLAKLGSINEFLWKEHRVVWSENFIKNIDDAYRRRNNECMNFVDLCKHLSVEIPEHLINVDINTINDDINSQRKEKERKEEERINLHNSKYLGDPDHKPPELPPKARDLLKTINNFFSIREHEENMVFRQIRKFIEHMLEEELLDQVKASFDTYVRNKSSGEFKHGIHKWIGTYEHNYRDGVWFQIKPEEIEPKVNPFKKPTRYKDLLEIQKKYVGDGT